MELGLAVGDEVSLEKIQALKEKSDYHKFLNFAYRYLSFRPRSEKEVDDYLKKKGADEKIREKIISSLKEKSLLNDYDFALWWVEQRLSFRPKGKRALRQELRRKGVDKEIISSVLEEKVNEVSLAKKILRRRASFWQKLPSSKRRRKETAYLLQRGFSWETINQVVSRLVDGNKEKG